MNVLSDIGQRQAIRGQSQEYYACYREMAVSSFLPIVMTQYDKCNIADVARLYANYNWMVSLHGTKYGFLNATFQT